jgi:hypothetical protein
MWIAQHLVDPNTMASVQSEVAEPSKSSSLIVRESEPARKAG